MFVFQNSLFAVRLGEELWMRMNTGAEQQGEGGAFLMLDFGC